MKFEELPGLLSPYQHWKFQVLPAARTTEELFVGMIGEIQLMFDHTDAARLQNRIMVSAERLAAAHSQIYLGAADQHDKALPPPAEEVA